MFWFILRVIHFIDTESIVHQCLPILPLPSIFPLKMGQNIMNFSTPAKNLCYFEATNFHDISPINLPTFISLIITDFPVSLENSNPHPRQSMLYYFNTNICSKKD